MRKLLERLIRNSDPDILRKSIVRDRGILKLQDGFGKLVMRWVRVSPLGKPEETVRVDVPARYLDHFAGMLRDPTAVDASGRSTLREVDFPYILEVRWDGEHRILSVKSMEDMSLLFRVRLSPLEARSLAAFCERCVISAHRMAFYSYMVAMLMNSLEGDHEFNREDGESSCG